MSAAPSPPAQSLKRSSSAAGLDAAAAGLDAAAAGLDDAGDSSVKRRAHACVAARSGPRGNRLRKAERAARQQEHRAEMVSEKKRLAIEAITKWREFALKFGTNDQVGEACVSFTKTYEQLDERFEDTEEQEYECKLCKEKIDFDGRSDEWIQMRGQLSILLDEESEEWF